MPVVIPKPRLLEPPKPEPIQSPPAGLTVAEVEAMLAARDAMWSSQLAVMTQALTDTIAAQNQQRKAVAIKFKHNERGTITGAEIVQTK